MPAWSGARGLVAAGIGVAIVGCGDGLRPSDLNIEGPPRVLAVTVRSETGVQSQLPQGEQPTFCSAQEGDYGEERLHAICLAALDGLADGEMLAPVTDAVPLGWQVRLVFNELLDADQVETISEGRGTLVETQPVTLECRLDETQDFQPVSYDGYYDPAGSHLTSPPGPALVVHLPIDAGTGSPLLDAFVATSSECRIAVDPEVRGKDGEQVLASARGPFSFGIAPLAVVGTDPADGAEGVSIDQEPAVRFNAPIDAATLTGAGGDGITLVPEGGEAVAATLSLREDDPATPEQESDPTEVVITPDAPLASDTSYTIQVNAEITDIKGGALVVDAAPVVLATFRTAATMTPDGGLDAGVDAGADAGVDAGADAAAAAIGAP